MQSDGEASRRKVLGVLAVGTGACALAAATLPFAAAVLEPIAPGAPREPAEAGRAGAQAGPAVPAAAAELPFLDVAAERDVVRGAPLRVSLRAPQRDGFFTVLEELGSAFLLRSAKGVYALSAACPHLGCAVTADPGAAGRGFVCPCHDSHFGTDGAFLRGPSPRGLDPLPVRIEAGRVLVQPLRYAPGKSERRAL